MAAPMVQEPASCGDIFIRGDIPSPWFVDTVSLTNLGPLKTYLPAGTPLTSGNAGVPNALSTMTKMLYVPVLLLPGVPTKASVIDTFYGVNAPGNFRGLKVNATKLPLSIVDFNSTNTVRTYTYSTMTGRLTTLGISWFEESTKYDSQNK